MDIWANDVKKHVRSIDWFLIITVIIANAYGFLLVKSATNCLTSDTVKTLFWNFTEQQRTIIVQSAAIFIGIVCMLAMTKMDYDHIVKYWKYMYAIAILFLVVTLIFGTGEADVGSKSWIRVMGIGIQPSELVKILFILTFSRHLDSVKEKLDKPKNILLLILHFGIIFALIVLQGDLGTALVFLFIFLAMCFAGGISLWYFLAGLFIAVAASPLVWNLMRDDQRMRILSGFNPMVDPNGAGYQALRSIKAIGSGGLFGIGYQKGYWTQHGLVPQQWTDFIFSAAGEEFGFIGALLVLILLALILVRIFYISRNARNNLGSLICSGVMAMFIAHIVENVGMCLGVLPVIGIPLPLFSYGGSSILGAYLAIGLILSVNSRKNIYYFTREENIDKF